MPLSKADVKINIRYIPNWKNNYFPLFEKYLFENDDGKDMIRNDSGLKRVIILQIKHFHEGDSKHSSVWKDRVQ